jgi:hypothetical protein
MMETMLMGMAVHPLAKSSVDGHALGVKIMETVRALKNVAMALLMTTMLMLVEKL